ncbi:hypothetical protein Tco_0210766 [Tanacetum coccineum]
MLAEGEFSGENVAKVIDVGRVGVVNLPMFFYRRKVSAPICKMDGETIEDLKKWLIEALAPLKSQRTKRALSNRNVPFEWIITPEVEPDLIPGFNGKGGTLFYSF